MEYLTAELILAYVALLGALGGGMKYVLARMDRERTRVEAERVRHELKVETERLRWEELMENQIRELRREIRLQEHEIGYLRVVSDAYLRHIAALEGLMKASGITIPELKLPVYRPLVETEDEEIEGEVVKPRRRRKGASA